MPRKPRYSYDRPSTSTRSASGSSGLPVNIGTLALCGGIFIIGIGVGIAYSSGQTLNTANVASREVIDRSAPDPEFCVQYGASAIVADMRLYLTLNPFTVYVTQPRMQPGCVMRRNNWTVLEKQGVINSEQVRDCRNRMNTFGYTGTLKSNPQINCIYQNDAAGNLFLNESDSANPKEIDRF